MRHLLIIGLGFVAAAALPPKAIGDTLNVGQILQVDFSTSAPVCPGGACDVLQLIPDESGEFFATNASAELLLGSTLLGTINTICCAPSFQSPSSLWTEGGTADFTAIDSGISNGIIDMSINTGYLTWPGTPTVTLFLGHATGPGVAAGIDLQVTSVTILSPVPEPVSISKFLGIPVLLLLGFRTRVKKAS